MVSIPLILALPLLLYVLEQVFFVAKHGNKAVSSQCGSANVLEALGIPLQTNSTETKELIESGIGFLLAPNYHPTLKYVEKFVKSSNTKQYLILLVL